jgi:hypothetical protein
VLNARILLLSLLGLATFGVASSATEKKVRLFILTGQSNMAGLDPKVSFTPAVQEAFSDDEVIVVKYALGGQPIRRWFKKWQLPTGAKDSKGTVKNGDLYDQLMQAVTKELAGKEPDSGPSFGCKATRRQSPLASGLLRSVTRNHRAVAIGS